LRANAGIALQYLPGSKRKITVKAWINILVVFMGL